MKRRPNVIIILASLCAIVFVWYCFVPHEPKYHGKKLSYWLSAYDTTRHDRPDRIEAEHAIREIGSNAVPTLLRMLKARPSMLRLKLQAILEKLPIPTDRFSTVDSGRTLALRAFAVLGPEAKSAVPSLVADLSDPDPDVRSDALRILPTIHAKQELVLPAMLKLLQSTNANDCNAAASAIVAYGADARPLVPELIAMVRKAPPAFLLQPVPPDPTPDQLHTLIQSSRPTNTIYAQSVAGTQPTKPIVIALPPGVSRTGIPALEAWNVLVAIDPDTAHKLHDELSKKD